MWILYAIIAAIVWGIDYVLVERIIKFISIESLIAIELLAVGIIFAAVAYFNDHIQQDLAAVFSSRKLLLLTLGGIAAFSLGNLFIMLSIEKKNATLAGFIEISYPLFIALFSWLLFKENQLTLGTLIGGGLIMVGVFVIYSFN